MKDEISRFSPWLDDRQAEGVAAAIRCIAGGSDRFLLEDGPGTGKTMECISIAWGLAKRARKTCILAVPTDAVADQFLSDMRKAEVKPGRLMVLRFDELTDKKIRKSAGIVIDEAHLLVSQEGRLPEFPTTTVMASGSAFDSAANAVAFGSWLSGRPRSECAAVMNMEIVYRDDKPVEVIPRDALTWRDVGSAMAEFSRSFADAGLSIRRDLDFRGDARLCTIAGSRSRWKQQMADLAGREIKRGQSPVLFVGPDEVVSTVSLLRSMDISSGTVEDLKSFRSGALKSIVLERGRDNEGVRLHDPVGNSPRTLILDELTSAPAMMQIQHRVVRRKSASDSTIIALFDPTNERDITIGLRFAGQCLFLDACGRRVPALAQPTYSELNALAEKSEKKEKPAPMDFRVSQFVRDNRQALKQATRSIIRPAGRGR